MKARRTAKSKAAKPAKAPDNVGVAHILFEMEKASMQLKGRTRALRLMADGLDDEHAQSAFDRMAADIQAAADELETKRADAWRKAKAA